MGGAASIKKSNEPATSGLPFSPHESRKTNDLTELQQRRLKADKNSGGSFHNDPAIWQTINRLPHKDSGFLEK